MRRTALVVCALVAIALQLVEAQTPPTPAIPSRPIPAGNIPVRRVILYKNGIGYGRWTHIDGFSESVIRFITEVENEH